VLIEMRYRQLDEITELDPGRRLVALRTLRAEEEYLRDHFPRFPVMPGVMMLEALHQAAVWMIRTGEDFASPLVVLEEAKNVKFADFLSPGQTLEITAELVKEEGDRVTVKTRARKADRITVSARLVLRKAKTGEREQMRTDQDVRDLVRQQFNETFGDVPMVERS
jgi:3-hydroxyacyl-[acyl-carrier-protein] dehydratase